MASFHAHEPHGAVWRTPEASAQASAQLSPAAGSGVNVLLYSTEVGARLVEPTRAGLSLLDHTAELCKPLIVTPYEPSLAP